MMVHVKNLIVLVNVVEALWQNLLVVMEPLHVMSLSVLRVIMWLI
jgi:hypothetical protein